MKMQLHFIPEIRWGARHLQTGLVIGRAQEARFALVCLEATGRFF